MDIERVRQELQESALREFPNPERTGCPAPTALEVMSRRRTQMTQEQLHHVTHCSPCLKAFLSIREEIRHRRVIRFRIAAMACAAAIALGVIVYTFTVRPASSPQMAVIAAPATLDLRPLSEYRGTDPGRAADAKPKLTLPRKRLQLTLYFPVGADEGQYTLQLLDGQLHTLLKQSLSASLQNHIVSATADLDLRSVTPGVHTLAIRKTGDEWRTFPVFLE
jgi:hypothetical protein